MINCLVLDDVFLYIFMYFLFREINVINSFKRNWRIFVKVLEWFWFVYIVNFFEEIDDYGNFWIIFDGIVCFYDWFFLSNMFGMY